MKEKDRVLVLVDNSRGHVDERGGARWARLAGLHHRGAAALLSPSSMRGRKTNLEGHLHGGQFRAAGGCFALILVCIGG